jgi:macrodomain Ter protein organizer (MatP/YcbG family)
MAKKRQYEVGENKLTSYVRVRLKEAEKQRLIQYVKDMDITMSELIVRLINQEILKA